MSKLQKWSEEQLHTHLKKSGQGIIEYNTTSPVLIKEQLPTIKQPRQHLEHDAQVAFFEWCARNTWRRWELDWFFAVPNGGHRHPAVGAMLKAEGQKSGIPDIFCMVPSYPYHFLAIEAKIGDNKPSPDQESWLRHFARCGGKTIVAYGFEEMKAAAVEYFGIEGAESWE